MNPIVTVSTKHHEVIQTQSNIMVCDVVWRQPNFMMDNLGRPATFLTDAIMQLHGQTLGPLPGSAMIKCLSKLSCHSVTP